MCINCCRFFTSINDEQQMVQQLEQLFDQYAVNQIPCTELSLQELLSISHQEQPVSLSHQFKLLSALSNNHWKPYITIFGSVSSGMSHVGLMHHLSCPFEHCRPVSLRNRFIHFLATGLLHQARSTLRPLCAPAVEKPKIPVATVPRQSDDDMPRLPSKRARRVNVRDLSVELALNLSQQDTSCDIYSEFKRKLVLDGVVCWRVHSADKDVLAMNDYDDETGDFMPSSFVHVVRKKITGEIIYECSCSMFRWIHATITSAKADNDAVWFGIEDSCMHCRFLSEEFEPRLTDLLQVDNREYESDVDKIRHKLVAAKQCLNHGIFMMSVIPSSITLKFSVCSFSSTNVNCSFVHLSKDGLFIRCQSGECQASQGAKKKPQIKTVNNPCLLLH